jgi:hypothetical protein
MAVARVVAQVGRDGDHHRQRADDHGGQRPAGALDGRGQAQVVQQVAHQGQLQRFQPVGARQLRQAARSSQASGSAIRPKAR